MLIANAVLTVGHEVREPGDALPEAAAWPVHVLQSNLNARRVLDVDKDRALEVRETYRRMKVDEKRRADEQKRRQLVSDLGSLETKLVALGGEHKSVEKAIAQLREAIAAIGSDAEAKPEPAIASATRLDVPLAVVVTEPPVAVAPPPATAEPVAELALDGMEREQLVAFAQKHGIEVDARLGERKLRAAIGKALKRAGD